MQLVNHEPNDTSPMTFSIIIATCGRPDRLRRSMSAVCRAALRAPGAHELLVVDNAPARDAAGPVRELAASAAMPVRYLETRPRDKARALNAGIEAARNRWLAFTDDDTLADDGWLAAAARFAQNGKYRFFGGRVVPAAPDGPLPAWLDPLPADSSFGFGVFVRYRPREDSGDLPAGAPVPFGANAFVRRDVFTQFGSYDERLWALCGRAALGVEDSEFGVRVKAAGERIGYCHEAVVAHPAHHRRSSAAAQLRLAYAYGWREPLVFFDPQRPPIEGYRLRVAAAATGRAMGAWLRGNRREAVEQALHAARAVGGAVCRLSPAYRQYRREKTLKSGAGD